MRKKKWMPSAEIQFPIDKNSIFAKFINVFVFNELVTLEVIMRLKSLSLKGGRFENEQNKIETMFKLKGLFHGLFAYL